MVTRAKALADLATGMSLRAAARKYGADVKTIRDWRDQGLRDGTLPTVPLEVGEKTPTAPRSELPDFGLMVGHYTAESLDALRAQARLFGNESWLKGQSASGLVELHRDLRDNTLRILSNAFRRVAIDTPSDPEPQSP